MRPPSAICPSFTRKNLTTNNHKIKNVPKKIVTMDLGRGGTWEGLGGPVRMDNVNLDGIDPTLDACCQREVSNIQCFTF